MIRGITGIVSPEDTVVGSFYLQTRYREDPLLIQRTNIPVSPGRGLTGLAFVPGEEGGGLYIVDLEGSLPLVAMPPVSIRISPPSVKGSSLTISRHVGMFMVADETPYVLASMAFRGGALINLLTGEAVNGRGPEQWVAFSNWLLVVDEAAEEITIASFGGED